MQRFSNVVLREQTSPGSAVNFIRINDFIKFSSSRDFANTVILKSNLPSLGYRNTTMKRCGRGGREEGRGRGEERGKAEKRGKGWDREVDRIVYVLNIYGTTKREEGTFST